MPTLIFTMGNAYPVAGVETKMTEKRWLFYQVASIIVSAGIFLLMTLFRHEISLRDLGVPIWIALAPWLMKPWDNKGFRGIYRSPARMIVAFSFLLFAQVALIIPSIEFWGWKAVVLSIVCGLIQLLTLVMFFRSLRKTARASK
jgi:hypothetical protein